MLDLSLAIYVLRYAAKSMKWRIPAKGFIRVYADLWGSYIESHLVAGV